jgi:hypothetical protein
MYIYFYKHYSGSRTFFLVRRAFGMPKKTKNIHRESGTPTTRTRRKPVIRRFTNSFLYVYSRHVGGLIVNAIRTYKTYFQTVPSGRYCVTHDLHRRHGLLNNRIPPGLISVECVFANHGLSTTNCIFINVHCTPTGKRFPCPRAPRGGSRIKIGGWGVIFLKGHKDNTQLHNN